jgi:uncharacterized membrane protein/protein-disulfide isomerase
MNAHSRFVLMALAAVALVVSLASLYFHHRMLVDPSYVSPCDINETVTCQAVYLSSYGTAFGVPVAAGGAIWSALVFLLAALGLGSPDRERASAAAGYTFVLSVVGLAAVFYFAYASFFVIGKVCVLCATMYAMVIGVFLVASRLPSLSLMSLPGRLLKDMRAVFARPVAATLAILWLVGSASLIAYFREDAAPAGQAGSTAVAAPAPVEALDQAQLDDWHAWLDRQPRTAEMAPQGQVKVLLVKFNDYQCPSCRAAYFAYKDSIAKFEKQYPGVFKFETRDYPLNPACGIGGVHPNACEGAAAVRLAREHNHGPEMENWLFEHQEEQSRETIKAALQRIAGVKPEEYEAKYTSILPKLHEDALLGNKLGVTGTPTFFLNGIKVPSVRVAHLEAAIEYELKKAGVS